MIDRDEDGRPDEAFYVVAEPCESCGEPTFLPRIWSLEYELMIATDCSCNVPQEPTCPLLIPVLEAADSVAEVCKVIREHRISCPRCRRKTLEIPKRSKEIPPPVVKEAA